MSSTRGNGSDAGRDPVLMGNGLGVRAARGGSRARRKVDCAARPSGRERSGRPDRAAMDAATAARATGPPSAPPRAARLDPIEPSSATKAVIDQRSDRVHCVE